MLVKGLIGACPGEVRKITIPPKLGYSTEELAKAGISIHSVVKIMFCDWKRNFC